MSFKGVKDGGDAYHCGYLQAFVCRPLHCVQGVGSVVCPAVHSSMGRKEDEGGAIGAALKPSIHKLRKQALWSDAML
jgi:hypothetical protein